MHDGYFDEGRLALQIRLDSFMLSIWPPSLVLNTG